MCHEMEERATLSLTVPKPDVPAPGVAFVTHRDRGGRPALTAIAALRAPLVR